jgi:hypothetical protein
MRVSRRHDTFEDGEQRPIRFCPDDELSPFDRSVQVWRIDLKHARTAAEGLKRAEYQIEK